MKKIPLTQGFIALVDDEDFEVLSKYKWFFTLKKDGRCASEGWAGNPKKRVYMHRFIMNLYDNSLCVDHINGDTLDNRRENLRICTHSQNMRNRRPSAKSTSGFKGVNWNKNSNKWEVRIKKDGKSIGVGYFNCLISAAKAYNEAAKKHHGEFARLNEIG